MRNPITRLTLTAAGGLAIVALLVAETSGSTSGSFGFTIASVFKGLQLSGHASAPGHSRSSSGQHSGSSTPALAPGSGSLSVGGGDINTGLLMRDPSPPPTALIPYVHGYIIEARWNVLQPAPGTLVTTRIDRAVAAVRKWNAAHPTNPRGLRLRITAGFNTPPWALTLGGAAVHLCSQSGACGLVPRWWTAPVEAAYAKFTQRLAAYVNPIPEIREVTVGLTMVRYGEIMVRFPKAAGNSAAYTAAGYTETQDIAAMKAEINDAKAFTAVTQIDVDDYQTPTNGQDLSISKEIMDYAIAHLARVQFANASITQSPTQNAAIFTLMKSYGPLGSNTASITFQTYPVLGSVSGTLNRALSFGACSVELPIGLDNPTVVGPFDTLFRANCLKGGFSIPSGRRSGIFASTASMLIRPEPASFFALAVATRRVDLQ
jgi:hypothetical protein